MVHIENISVNINLFQESDNNMQNTHFLEVGDVFQITEYLFMHNVVALQTNLDKIIGLEQFRVNQDAWVAFNNDFNTTFKVVAKKQVGNNKRGSIYKIEVYE